MSTCKDTFTYTWNIQNYSFCDKRNGSGLSSPSFTADNLDESSWIISLYPRGHSKENEGYVSLKVEKRSGFKTLKRIKDIDFNVEFWCSNAILLSSTTKQCNDMVEYRQLGYVRFFFDKVMITNELEKKIKDDSEDTLSVRICFSSSKSVAEKDTTKKGLLTKTTLGVTQMSFICKIKYDHKIWDWSVVKTFTIFDSQFEISFIKGVDDISIKIHRIGFCNNCTQYHIVKGKITLLDIFGNGPFKCDSILYDCRSKSENVWYFPTFLKRSYLSDANFINFFHDRRESYEIVLKFNFSFSNGLTESESVPDETNSISSSHKLSDNLAVSSLQSDFRNLFLSKKYADIKFQINKDTFSSHKHILASRSPVFSAMFDQDMNKTQTKTIEISDMKPETMKLFLEFLYTGVIEKLNYKTVLELLLVAEKYQVPSLTEECIQFLTSDFDADNIFDVVSFADKVTHRILKVLAFKYIKKNTARILSSPNWITWFKENIEIGSEILCYLSENLKTVNLPYDM